MLRRFELYIWYHLLVLQALTIDSSTGVRVKGLTVQSAQQIHFTISKSDAVRVSGIHARSPRDSPNTDGIHISESTNIAIQNCNIGTGAKIFKCFGFTEFLQPIQFIIGR